jgi:hypothetical protein
MYMYKLQTHMRNAAVRPHDRREQKHAPQLHRRTPTPASRPYHTHPPPIGLRGGGVAGRAYLAARTRTQAGKRRIEEGALMQYTSARAHMCIDTHARRQAAHRGGCTHARRMCQLARAHAHMPLCSLVRHCVYRHNTCAYTHSVYARPFPPIVVTKADTSAPEDVEHPVGRRREAHYDARGGGGAGGGQRRPGVVRRAEAVNVVEPGCVYVCMYACMR